MKQENQCAKPTDSMRDSAEMAFRIPVFLSHPSTLNTIQTEFLDRLIKSLEKALLFPRTLPDTEQYPEKTLTSVRRIVLSSYGLIAVNMQQVFATYTQTNTGSPPPPPSWEGAPFLQIEPAMAFQRGLPLLLIKESGVASTGMWNPTIEPYFIIEWNSSLPLDAFFKSIEWKELLQNWAAHVRSGYYIQTEPEFKYRCNPND